MVRRNAARDVALVTTESPDVPALHASLGRPSVGQDVFAIGSPLGSGLSGTFTRGVLSGFRQFGGRNYIQSDVAINPGNSGGPLLDGASNAIGITVVKIAPASGLSFFIPIDEALVGLGIVLE